MAAMKFIGSIFFFLDEKKPSKVLEEKNKDKKPRNALENITESKFHRVTKLVSFNFL